MGLEAGRDIYSVSRLNAEIRAVLEGSFPLLWVEGELSNLATPRSGHLYFSLKDEHAQVRCALFRNKRILLREQPSDGDRVLVRARIGLYEPRGDYQLIVEHLEPAGQGTAQQAFEQLKRKLQAEGLFESARKRDLPAFPQRLGLITSPSGAAIRDVLQVLRRRAPYLPVTVFPALVQGTEAPRSLLEALTTALARGDCDVLLMTRGGGSAEDLAAFNDEALARAIAAAAVPIVSAVGHEIDFSISDFVADRRAPTPSAAAELISPDSAELRSKLDANRRRMDAALQRQALDLQQQLDKLSGRLKRAAPANRLRQQQQQLDRLDVRLVRNARAHLVSQGDRLKTSSQRLLRRGPAQVLMSLDQRRIAAEQRLHRVGKGLIERQNDRLTATVRQLQALSPLATMQRGYSILRHPQDGGIVTSVGDLDVGARLQGLLQDGSVDLEVRAVSFDDKRRR